MRVVAWNMGHRTGLKDIPEDLPELFVGLDADVILLNEFVDRDARRPFRDSMSSVGYPHQLVSATAGRYNQVYAAAREPFVLGDLVPPSLTGPATAGFLHIRFADNPIELVGFRAPDYRTAAETNDYWEQVAAILSLAADRPIAFAGDFNRDPFKGAPDTEDVHFPGAEAFRVPNPSGRWSFCSPDGPGRSRIDHVMHTLLLDVTESSYVEVLGDRILAGPRELEPISDHAALTFVVSS